MKFNIVYGNPPYNDSSNEGKSVKLWTKITAKAIDLIQENGYLNIIIPASWVSASNNVINGQVGLYKDYFSKYSLERVYFNIDKFFPHVGSTFSAIVLKKNEVVSKDTTWITDNEKMVFDIRNKSFLPPKMNSIMLSILDKTINQPNSFSVVSMTKGDKNRKQGKDTPDNLNKIKHYVRGGNLYKVHYAYFSTTQNTSLANKRKIILPNSGADKFMPFVDDIGIPFCTGGYIILLNDEDKYESALTVFNSKLFRFLVEQTRTSGFCQYIVLKSFPKVDLTRMWTEQDLYDYFDLTQEEISYIEQYTKPLNNIISSIAKRGKK